MLSANLWQRAVALSDLAPVANCVQDWWGHDFEDDDPDLPEDDPVRCMGEG